MSFSYAISVKLNFQFTKENVEFIIQKASDMGFIYLVVENFGITSQRLSNDEAILKLFTTSEEILDDGGPSLYGKFQDTGMSIWIYQSDNDVTGLLFGSFCYKWDKDFSNGKEIYTIDFARYIRLITEICNGISILRLSTTSDVTENLVYEYQNCVVAVLDMGNFDQNNSYYINCGRRSVKYFLANGIQNGFDFFDYNTNESIKELSAQKYYDILKTGFSAYLYAEKDNISFKIEIKHNVQGYDAVAIYPLEPYLMKKGYGSEDEKIDVAFYVQRLIELCENFAIYELKTFF